MANKKNYKGPFILVLAAVIVGGLVSCISIQKVKETETSKMLLGAANEILAAGENGMLLDEFKVAYEAKFAGLKFDGQDKDLGSTTGGSAYLDFLYEGINYRLRLDQSGETVSLLGIGIRYVSAGRCVEVEKTN